MFNKAPAYHAAAPSYAGKKKNLILTHWQNVSKKINSFSEKCVININSFFSLICLLIIAPAYHAAAAGKNKKKTQIILFSTKINRFLCIFLTIQLQVRTIENKCSFLVIGRSTPNHEKDGSSIRWKNELDSSVLISMRTFLHTSIQFYLFLDFLSTGVCNKHCYWLCEISIVTEWHNFTPFVSLPCCRTWWVIHVCNEHIIMFLYDFFEG